MDPYLYCKKRAAESGSNFHLSFRFLSPEKRKAITVLYAFCREMDDIVDQSIDKNIATIKLAWWREAITSLQEKPQHPICQALAPYQLKFNIPIVYFLDIITGMEMDLTKNRYQTYQDLEIYCYHAAGAVGLIILHVLGFQDPQSIQFAKNLGISLQLINIIRDVGEDALRGRIYIPSDELTKHSISEKEILTRQYSVNFSTLMQTQADRAKQIYTFAKKSLSSSDRKNHTVSFIMGAIYYELLLEIEKDNFQVLHQKITLNPLFKIWISLRTYIQEKKIFRQ